MVASTIDVTAEDSITSAQEVNSGDYQTLHNGQIFKDGLSFSGNERNCVWLNTGQAFADLSALSGADSPNDSRAAIACDFDDDGDVDLFVHSIQRERHGLYRNDLDLGERYLKVRLRGTASNPEAVGAIVVVEGPVGLGGATAQVLSRGGGFVTCQAPELVFGLGGAEEAEVSVIWPGAKRESFGVQAAGSRIELVEGASTAKSFAANPRRLPNPLPRGLLLAEGDIVPVLAVKNGKGERVDLDLRAVADGKPLMVNFWASFCAPCVAEIPVLSAIMDKGEVRVVAVSMDAPDDVALARSLLKKHGATYESFYLGGRAAGDTVAIEDLVDLRRLPIPTTLILSAEGRVETILRGPIKGE